MRLHLLKVLRNKESNMGRKHRGYWTKENCLLVALGYTSKAKFQKEQHGAYVAAKKGGFWDDICMHMEPQANGYLRYLYSIEFESIMSVYIGITTNLCRRKWQHENNSSNKRVKELLDEKTPFKWVIHPVELNKLNAGSYECDKIKEYKGNGWIVLNDAPAGALGTNRKIWTKNKCKQIAALYDNKKDFYTKNKSAYQAAVNNSWLDEISIHMLAEKRPNGYWNNIDLCRKEAASCTYKTEFQRKFPAAYKIALKNGWLTEITKHFKEVVKPVGFWTKEACLNEALKYKTRSEFQNKSRSAYASAQRNGWLRDMYKHMDTKYKEDGYWGIEECRREALKYKSRTEFSIKSGGAYNAAKKNGWLNDICAHLPKKKPCILN